VKAEAKEESRVIHINGQTFVRLDREDQERAGLQVLAAGSGEAGREIEIRWRSQPHPHADRQYQRCA
jgi:hypothetical protein